MSVLAAWAAGAGVLGAAFAAPGAAPADPARDEGPVYAFGLRAAVVEPFVRAARELPLGVGFSRIDLARDTAGFRCDAVASAYWLGVYEERWPVYSDTETYRGEGPLGPNPTAARVGRPGRAAWPDQSPGPQPAASRRAGCDDAGTAGRSADLELDDAGIRLGGSATSAAIDAATGRFTGDGRAYVQGLGPSTGALDAVSSTVAVTAVAGEEPTVTYRLTLLRADPGSGARSAFDQDGLSLVGRDVPAGDLVRQFQDQVRDHARELAPFAALGVTVLEPAVTTQDGVLAVTAPAVAVAGGATVIPRYLGREQGVRLGAVTYSSRHPLRPKEPHL